MTQLPANFIKLPREERERIIADLKRQYDELRRQEDQEQFETLAQWLAEIMDLKPVEIELVS
jgi:hypothetical protein